MYRTIVLSGLCAILLLTTPTSAHASALASIIINAPPSVSLEASSPGGAFFDYAPITAVFGTPPVISGYDFIGTDPIDIFTDLPGTGSLIELGLHTYFVYATGNFNYGAIPPPPVDSDEFSFPPFPTDPLYFSIPAEGNAFIEVLVQDTTAPELLVSDLFFNTTDLSGILVTDFLASAADLFDPNPLITYDIAPGSLFGVGETDVMATATDSNGRSSMENFVVHVNYAPSTLSAVPEPTSFCIWSLGAIGMICCTRRRKPIAA